MTAAEFVESIAGFSKLNTTEQVKRFCWHLAMQCQKPRFTGADVVACFNGSGCPKPSGITPFLTSLVKQKFLIKRSNRYELSRIARDKLDPVLGKRDATIAVDKLLQELPGKLTIQTEKVFLEEALVCFRHSAFRAAIVMTWNLAYDHLCKVILNDPKRLSDFNTQLPLTFRKPAVAAINLQDDFEALKESEVLQVAKSAGIISNSVHKILKEKLDRRNTAAHPSNIVITQHTSEEFILDLVQNVVLKL